MVMKVGIRRETSARDFHQIAEELACSEGNIPEFRTRMEFTEGVGALAPAKARSVCIFCVEQSIAGQTY
jgi:hypothetical protein